MNKSLMLAVFTVYGAVTSAILSPHARAVPVTIHYEFPYIVSDLILAPPEEVSGYTVPDPVPPLIIGNQYYRYYGWKWTVEHNVLDFSIDITYDPECQHIALQQFFHEDISTARPTHLKQLMVVGQYPDGELYWGESGAPEVLRTHIYPEQVTKYWPVVVGQCPDGSSTGALLGITVVGLLCWRRRSVMLHARADS
jgi:hypothetical protein